MATGKPKYTVYAYKNKSVQTDNREKRKTSRERERYNTHIELI